jgi:iron complex transport system ATP-binding protein
MTEAQETSLSCSKLGITVPGRELVADLDLQIAAGEIVAILGPNGVGKSLTLHTLAALRAVHNGEVRLGANLIDQLTRQQIASQLALLPQHTDDVFPTTVLDTVLIGRHPHIQRFQWETGHDRDIAFAALREVDLESMHRREVATLSGGERRRLAVAQVLTQAPQVFLLDEPTNHLDPQHQLDVLRIFQSRAQAGAAVVVSLHDVNLAARFADRCLLLYGDGRWTIGATNEVLSADRLTNLYGTTMEAIGWRNTQLFVAAG